MQSIPNQIVVVLWHYTIIVVTPELKTDFSYIKTLIFDLSFLKVFNAIDSPDIVSSSKQPKYVTLEYCFILIPLYIILSFLAFFNLSFDPKSMHFVLSSTRWILNLLSTNHSHKLAKSLFNWCSIVWTFLSWTVRPESSSYKNRLEWTTWGISLAYSKNRSGPKIDSRGKPPEILDKSEKWLLMLTLNGQSDKYDLNHAIAFSEKPIAFNLPRRIS